MPITYISALHMPIINIVLCNIFRIGRYNKIKHLSLGNTRLLVFQASSSLGNIGQIYSVSFLVSTKLY